MKKLLSHYGFTENSKYFDMCIESMLNGQYTQAAQQFIQLPRINKKEMLWYIINYHEKSTFFKQTMTFFIKYIY